MKQQWSKFLEPDLPIGSARSFFIKAAAHEPPKLANSFSSWIIPLKFKQIFKQK